MIYKIIIVIKSVSNWYKLFIDKIFGGKNIIYKFRNGLHIECRTKSPDINEAVVIISGKEYPKNELNIDKSNEFIVFDLGGNIGSFSVWFDFLNRTKKYKGFVFEPDPDNLSLLSKNLNLNQVSKFKVEALAVSSKTGVLKFDISGSPDAYKINDEAKDNFIEVHSVSLSEYCKNNKISKIDILKIDILKIDIEGGEYSILENDFEFIKNNVYKVIMEFHNLDSKYNIDYIKSVMNLNFNLDIMYENKFNGVFVAKNKMTL